MNTTNAVQDFLAGCRARGLSPRTIAWYRSLLLGFARSCPELPDQPARIEYFLGAEEISDELRHGRFRALRAFYGWASQRLGVTNPMTAISAPRKRKKLPRTLTLADMGCLLLAPLTRRNRAMIVTLIDTGIRVGELVGLDREDVGDETIFVTGKTGQREVPISESVRRQLLDLASSGPLFRGSRGRLTTWGAYQAIRQALIRAGISGKKLGPHTLRHTFGRQYIVAGGDLVSLQRILGHASIATTRIYAELDLGDVVGQHHRFTPLKWATSVTQGQLFGTPPRGAAAPLARAAARGISGVAEAKEANQNGCSQKGVHQRPKGGQLGVGVGVLPLGMSPKRSRTQSQSSASAKALHLRGDGGQHG